MRALQVLLRLRGFFRPGFGGLHFADFLIEQSRERLIGQGTPPFQISAHDQFPLGVADKPTLSVAQEFIDLGVADVIVLLFVQHRQQDIQVGQKIVNGGVGAERQSEVVALAPFREFFVKRDLRCLDRISERLEQFAAARPRRRAIG